MVPINSYGASTARSPGTTTDTTGGSVSTRGRTCTRKFWEAYSPSASRTTTVTVWRPSCATSGVQEMSPAASMAMPSGASASA